MQYTHIFLPHLTSPFSTFFDQQKLNHFHIEQFGMLWKNPSRNIYIYNFHPPPPPLHTISNLPVSPTRRRGFGLNGRSGNSEQLAKMIATCRAAGVEVCRLLDGDGVATVDDGVHHFRTNRLPWIKSTLKIASMFETLGDSGFLRFFWVVSSDYGKPRMRGFFE